MQGLKGLIAMPLFLSNVRRDKACFRLYRPRLVDVHWNRGLFDAAGGEHDSSFRCTEDLWTQFLIR